MAAPATAAEAKGPLRAHPTNPRYFTDGTTNPDGSLKAVYLTGWARDSTVRGARTVIPMFGVRTQASAGRENGGGWSALRSSRAGSEGSHGTRDPFPR